MKSTCELTSYFHEWEGAAFNEVKAKLGVIYSQEEKEHLNDENRQIRETLTGNLEDIQYPTLLLKDIFEFYHSEPIIFRVIVHNAIDPEDIEMRGWLREKYIPEKKLDYYRYRWIWEGLLEGGDLAKSIKVQTIPQHLFLVGQMLDVFLKDYSHFEKIDHVKLTGVKENIADLRETRIRTKDNVTIMDYSPFYIDTNTKHNAFSYDLDREVFSEPDFREFKKEEFYQMENEVIRILCHLLFLTKSDRRQDRFTGNDLQPAKINFTVHFKNEKKHIPCQIFPIFREMVSKKNADAKQDLLFAILEAVRKAGEIWPEYPKAYIKKVATGKFSDAFDDISTVELKKKRMADLRWQHIQSAEEDVKTLFKERISNSEMEHSGGSLDDFINPDDEDAGTRSDSLIDKNILDPESTLINKDILEKAGVKHGYETMTPAERKRKERQIRKAKKNLNVKR